MKTEKSGRLEPQMKDYESSMQQENLVSIIMPSYNTGRFILETIHSVCSQTWTNWELLIVDDCSTDDTVQIVNDYIAKRQEKGHENRIRLFVNEKNSGAACSRNYALQQASGRWIAFLDSDDLWMPTKLEQQIAFMKENQYSFSYTNYHEIDEGKNALGRVVSGPTCITKAGMYRYCWPGCLTVMYDRQVVGEIQIADIKKNNDYAMWLKVIQKANCYLLSEDLAAYRRRSGSISNHGYRELIKWHYRLFRQAEQKNMIESLFLTAGNLFFGFYKKIRYVKSIEDE